MKKRKKKSKNTYDMHLGNFACHIIAVIQVLNPGPPLRCCHHPSCVVVCVLTHRRCSCPLLLIIKMNTY